MSKIQHGLGFNQQDDEIVVDLLCGGGSTCAKLKIALGRAVTFAKNHNLAAISIHTVNRPYAKHFASGVSEHDGQALDLVYASYLESLMASRANV